MQLYNRGQQKPGWKDPRTSNAETQTHVDVSTLGIKKRYWVKMSCRFRLDGLDALTRTLMMGDYLFQLNNHKLSLCLLTFITWLFVDVGVIVIIILFLCPKK
jgi:hypothetical protein